MNLKISCVIRAAAIVVLAFSLAACGNKGPLVLAESPPAAQAQALPVIPPMDEATVPPDAMPEDGTPVPPTSDDDTPVTPPPPASSGDGHG